MKISREVILGVKELLERHWNVTEIAHRMNLDPAIVQVVIDFINNALT